MQPSDLRSCFVVSIELEWEQNVKASSGSNKMMHELHRQDPKLQIECDVVLGVRSHISIQAFKGSHLLCNVWNPTFTQQPMRDSTLAESCCCCTKAKRSCSRRALHRKEVILKVLFEKFGIRKEAFPCFPTNFVHGASTRMSLAVPATVATIIIAWSNLGWFLLVTPRVGIILRLLPNDDSLGDNSPKCDGGVRTRTTTHTNVLDSASTPTFGRPRGTKGIAIGTSSQDGILRLFDFVAFTLWPYDAIYITDS